MTKHCYDISYLPSSRTFVLTYNSFCQLVGSTEQFIDDVALALDINKNKAGEAVAHFFQDRTILVQQSGVQGYIYKVSTFVQTAGSATMVPIILSLAKMAGVSGLQVIKAQPLLLIALPTLGAMFFQL